MLQPQRWINVKPAQTDLAVDIIGIDELKTTPGCPGFFLQHQQVRKRLFSNKGMAYNLEVIELVQLYIDPKDVLLVEHKILMPRVAADRHSKVFFAPQIRIIAQSLFEADL